MKRLLALLATICMMGVLLIPMPAQAAVQCDSGFGTRVPVLMVHGFDGNPDIWDNGGNSSMVNTVRAIPGTEVVSAFNYESVNQEWVTHAQIGPRLAETIRCYAIVSRNEGGAGKVIVIAHSMGGLALREAVSRVIDGRQVSNDVGLAITIGTPHTGTPLASLGGSGLSHLCRATLAGVPGAEVASCYRSWAVRGMMKGSRELSRLPKMPSSISLRAIAGDVTLYRWWQPTGSDLDSDIAVPVDSATAEYTTQHLGDGRFVFECTAESFLFYIGPATCEHSALVTNPGVQANVIQAISEYLRGNQTPDPGPMPTPTPTASEPLPPMPSPT